MSIGAFTLGGLGPGSTIGLFINSGFGIGDAVAGPTVSALDYSAKNRRAHFSAEGRTHFSAGKPIHYVPRG